MNIPQPITLRPQASEFPDRISTLPESGGVYCLVISAGAPHLAWSANLPRRLKRIFSRKSDGDHSAVDLRARLERIDCWPASSKLESSLLMYTLARRLFPENYEPRLRLRRPWFVAAADLDGFPRLTVTSPRDHHHDALWGPFVSRDAAEYYREEVLRLYQIRRCTDPLHPAPEHSGCIYGEMNQCLRPCQCAVTRAEYLTEFAHVSDFVNSNGKTVLSTLSAARALASEKLEFEQAAQIHKRVEQVKSALAAREDYIGQLCELHGIAITKGPSPVELRLWPMIGGIWQDPIAVNVSLQQPGARSMDATLRERITSAFASPSRDGDPFEHLSLFLKWYRSSWRDGPWVGFHSLASLNYRRLVREISKLVKQSEDNAIN